MVIKFILFCTRTLEVTSRQLPLNCYIIQDLMIHDHISQSRFWLSAGPYCYEVSPEFMFLLKEAMTKCLLTSIFLQAHQF